jgi:solute carrier family 25 (adenine nucleotide translocator) protein 4/5/6/31
MKPYKGTFHCIKAIKKYEGYRAFWKGNFANILRVLPNETFNFFMKESIQLWVKKHKLATDNNPSLNFISASVGAVFTLAFIYPMDFARAKLTNDISGKKSIKMILA